METLKYKSITFNSWDVGGRDKIVSYSTTFRWVFVAYIFKFGENDIRA